MPRMMFSSGLACGEAPSSSIGPAPPAVAELLSAAATWQPRTITFNNGRNPCKRVTEVEVQSQGFCDINAAISAAATAYHEHDVIHCKFKT